MHITLISPPQIFTKSQEGAGVVPPLGILYLASYLKKFNIDTTIIDSVGDKYYQYNNHNDITLRGLTFQEILNKIPENTDLIGISALYSQAHLMLKELIYLIKKKFPSIKIVLGGAHPSALPEFVLKNLNADIVVVGEGESTMLDLCQHFGNYKSVKGIVYKENNRVYFNPSRELIEDIDDLSFPDRESINFDNYFKAAEPHGCSVSKRWTTLLSSRGCVYECTFCTQPIMWRRRWRKRSVGNVIQEMVELNRNYGIIDFHFEDENMGFDKKWMHQFCDTLIKEKLNFTWQPSNGLRVETVLDEGLLEKIKKSGCSLLVFGLESGSQRINNDIIRKKLDIRNIEKAVSMTSKIGIKTSCYSMIGLPTEKIYEAQATINYACFLARKGLDEFVLTLFVPRPACELFNNLYKQGKIKLDSKFFKELSAAGDITFAKSWSEHISDEELKKLHLYGYLKFAITKTIFHPLKVIKSVYNIFREVDQLKSERVIRTLIKRLRKSKRK